MGKSGRSCGVGSSISPPKVCATICTLFCKNRPLRGEMEEVGTGSALSPPQIPSRTTAELPLWQHARRLLCCGKLRRSVGFTLADFCVLVQLIITAIITTRPARAPRRPPSEARSCGRRARAATRCVYECACACVCVWGRRRACTVWHTVRATSDLPVRAERTQARIRRGRRVAGRAAGPATPVGHLASSIAG
jgi:hypothetical protein